MWQSLTLVEDWLDESNRDHTRLVNVLSRRYAPVHVLNAHDALPDLNRLRQIKVRPQQQEHEWLSIVRSVAAEGRIPPKDLHRLSQLIRQAFNKGGSWRSSFDRIRRAEHACIGLSFKPDGVGCSATPGKGWTHDKINDVSWNGSGRGSASGRASACTTGIGRSGVLRR